jgi:hypothetical protein
LTRHSLALSTYNTVWRWPSTRSRIKTLPRLLMMQTHSERLPSRHLLRRSMVLPKDSWAPDLRGSSRLHRASARRKSTFGKQVSDWMSLERSLERVSGSVATRVVHKQSEQSKRNALFICSRNQRFLYLVKARNYRALFGKVCLSFHVIVT